MTKFNEIQSEVIVKYRIIIVENSSCYTRTHAHCDGTRRICKWKQANSIASTFTLLHEIGHIMTYKHSMRRAESEYYATIWALERCKEYGIKVPDKIIAQYQRYIDMETRRGIRRGGTDYKPMNLMEYKSSELVENKIKEPKKHYRRFVL